MSFKDEELKLITDIQNELILIRAKIKNLQIRQKKLSHSLYEWKEHYKNLTPEINK